MGGSPSKGTPADQRLSENQAPDSSSSASSDSDPSRDSSPSAATASTGNDRPYNTFMPWASQ